MFLKKRCDILNADHITPRDNHIVHIDCKNNALVCSGLAKDSRLYFVCQETTLQNESVEFNEPSSRALFETIDGFVKTTYLGGFGLNHVARRLLHIDLIIEIAIEKDIRDV